MFPALLICAFMVKYAATQTVSTSLGITKSCVLIGNDVKLLCTVSSGCCSSQFRVWQKVGVVASLLNDGVSSDEFKYVEDYDNGTTGYNLIIKNVQKTDLGANYKCVYGLKSSELFLDGILCNCGECAGQDYGWSILGVVIGTIIIFIIAKIKIGELKTTLMVGGLTFIISAVVNAIIAVPIGYYVCHCVDGTDPLLIVLGLGTSGIIGVIVLIIAVNKQKQGSVKLGQDQKSSGFGDDVMIGASGLNDVALKDGELMLDPDVDGIDASLMLSTNRGLVDIFTDECLLSPLHGVPTVQVQQPSYSVTTGSTVVLVCTVTSDLTITSVEWERNVDGIKTTIVTNTNKYRGSSTTTPSLTIFNAEFSDEGTYTCVAFNRDGTGQSTTTLRVTGR